jgi:hypothetical protein
MTRRPSPLVVLAGLLVVTAPAVAQTFRWVDSAGVTHYSDHVPQTPKRAVEEITVRGDAIVSRPPAVTQRAAGGDDAQGSSPSPVADDDGVVAEEPPLIEPSKVPAPVTEILESAAVRPQLERLSREALSWFDAAAARIEAAQARRGLLARAFDPNTLERRLAHVLTERLDASRREQLLAWFRSPLGRRIARLEAEASRPGPAHTMVRFVDELPTRLPSAKRIGLVQRLLRAQKVTLDLVEARTLFRAAVERTARLQPGALTLPYDDEASQLQLAEAATLSYVVTAVYAYRELTDEELGAYVAFAESPAGDWLTRTYRGVVLDAPRPPARPAVVRASATERQSAKTR